MACQFHNLFTSVRSGQAFQEFLANEQALNRKMRKSLQICQDRTCLCDTELLKYPFSKANIIRNAYDTHIMENCPPVCTIIMVQMLISLHDTTAGFQVQPVSNNLYFWTCRPLSFFFEFCHKAGAGSFK